MKRIALLLRIYFSPIKARQEEEHFYHLRVTRVRELRDEMEGDQENQEVRNEGKIVKKIYGA